MNAHNSPTDQRIFVGTTESVLLWDAVTLGGGIPTTDIADARAMAWSGDDVSDLVALLHDGIEWLQLPSAGACASEENPHTRSADSRYGGCGRTTR